jgi:hypothetical protein
MAELVCVCVAARQGAKVIQKHVWTEYDPRTTLRQVGSRILPDGELLRVEASKDIDGSVSSFAGGMLGQPVSFVVDSARCLFIKCCFATDAVAVALNNGWVDGKKDNQNRFDALHRLSRALTELLLH